MSTQGKHRLGVTQQEIADMLSLSRSTVAFALNPKHRHKLLPETLQLVLDKAREYNYRPQKAATVLGTGKSNTIGVVYRLGLYHAQIERLRHLAHSVIAAGYQIVTVDISWFQGNMEAVYQHLIDAAVEGIIYCNLDDAWLTAYDYHPLRQLPQISISGETMEGVENISTDIGHSFYELTRHHLEQGSKELLLQFFYHDPGYCGFPGEALTRRLDGYRRAIEEAGGSIELSPPHERMFGVRSSPRRCAIHGRLGFPVREPRHTSAFSLGYQEALQVIDSDQLPDSVLCSNDEIAAGWVTACLKRKVSIPDQVRISGADDAPFAAYCGIPITTVRQPAEKLGRLAVERLLEKIHHPDSASTHAAFEPISCELVIRDSTVQASNSTLHPIKT